MSQAIAQTRIDDLMRAADRRRRVSIAHAARDLASSAPKSLRTPRRLRLRLA